MPRKRRLVVIKWTAINHIQRYPDVAEIACLAVNERGDGFEAEAPSTALICPRGSISEEFTRATGLYPGTLEAQPALEAFMPALIEALGNDVLVFETPMERAAFEKMCVPHKPENLMLDVVTLGMHIFPSASPTDEPHNLLALTQLLNVEPATTCKAADIADQIAQVLTAALGHVAKRGRWETIKEALKKKLPKRRISRRGNKPATMFDMEKLKAMSAQPGVYFMKNEAGEILYIGKAKNLRNRLRSYFQSPKRLPAKVLELLRQVSRIDTQEVGSELEALLTEARLIKQHQPFFNKMIKNFQRLAFLKITAYEPYPKLLASSEMDDPRALYFGPFSSINIIQNRMDIMNRVFELRGCSDREFAEHSEYPCMDYDMGLCSGPCAKRIPSEDYRQRVDDFVDYLSERPSRRIQELTVRRDLLAEELQFEKAATIQQRLEVLEGLQWDSCRFVEAVQRHNCIIVLPGTTPGSLRLLTVLQGQPVSWHGLDTNGISHREDLETLTFLVRDAYRQQAELFSKPVSPSVTKLLYEEARILCAWLSSDAMDEYGVFYLNEKEPETLMQELENYIFCRMPLEAMPVYEEDWEEHGIEDWSPPEWEEDEAAISGGS